MDDLPAPLARALVEVDHDSIQLVVKPVFTPAPRWVLFALSGLILLGSFGTICLAVTIIDGEGLSNGVPALIFAGLQALAAFKLAGAWSGGPLGITLGAHRLELRSGKRVEYIPLADLESFTVADRQLTFVLRQGKVVTVAAPERSRATAHALEKLLHQAMERGRQEVAEVPSELQELVNAQQRQSQ